MTVETLLIFALAWMAAALGLSLRRRAIVRTRRLRLRMLVARLELNAPGRTAITNIGYRAHRAWLLDARIAWLLSALFWARFAWAFGGGPIP